MFFLGSLLIVIGLSLFFVVRPYIRDQKEQNAANGTANSSNILLLGNLSGKMSLFAVVFGLCLTMYSGMFFWAEAGKQYFLVYPWGEKGAIMSQGIKPKFFAKVTAWDKWIDIAAPIPGEEESVNSDEIEGIMKSVPIRFIDQVTANMYPSLRFQIPVDEEDFKDFAVKYRTVENLVYNTLIPAIKEQCVNTAYMFTAQDYISGEAQSFRSTFDEMLTDGAYVVEKTEIKDTTWTTGISMNNSRRDIKAIQVSFSVEKVIDEETGLPLRVKHEITENNIIVSQVIVASLVLDREYRERLKDQKAESAQRQLEHQKIETAKIAQMRVIAEGERSKSEERVKQEKEQVKTLIAIETKLKEEKTNKLLAQIALETERLNSQKKKVSADAIYYENSKRVAAGLTPQEKAEWEYKTAIGVAKELAKLRMPSTMIMGGGEGSTTPIEALIGAAMARQLTGEGKK